MGEWGRGRVGGGGEPGGWEAGEGWGLGGMGEVGWRGPICQGGIWTGWFIIPRMPVDALYGAGWVNIADRRADASEGHLRPGIAPPPTDRLPVAATLGPGM